MLTSQPNNRWAWGHCNRTTKISSQDRPTKKPSKGASWSLAKCNRKLPARAENKLIELNILLRAQAFSRWPLSLHFLARDVWETWQEVRDATTVGARNIPTTTDFDGTGTVTDGIVFCLPVIIIRLPNVGIYTHADSIQDCAQKTHLLLSQPPTCTPQSCTICTRALQQPHDTTVVCPHEGCTHMFHITCLSSEFLAQEAQSNVSPRKKKKKAPPEPLETQVLPLMGRCPGCEKPTRWINIVKPLSSRLTTETPKKKPDKTPAKTARKSASRKSTI